MKKTTLILTALLALTACDAEFRQTKQIIKPGAIYSEICIDGVVYLRSGNSYLTPKINRDAIPVSCEIPQLANVQTEGSDGR